VLAAILAVLVARAAVTYGLGALGNRLSGRWGDPIPWRWLHVLNWGGLRGAIALALALSLPAALGDSRELVKVMTFGVVLFTLVVQSMTMRPLLRRLGILERDPVRVEYQTRHARLLAFRAAALHLDEMHRDGLLSENAWEVLRPQLQARVEQMGLDLRALQRTYPRLEDEELANARHELLRAERSALQTMQRNGVITEEVYEKLVTEVDAALSADRASEEEPQLESNQSEPRDGRTPPAA
jgi:monovalent cation:H+ antiporter, CPA1 family